MKKYLAVFSLALLMLSCNKEAKVTNNQSDSMQVASEFVVDSLRVNDSLAVAKNLTVAFDKQVLIFPSITDKVLLDSIYKPVDFSLSNYDKNSLKTALDQAMKKYFEDNKSTDFIPEFKQTWDEQSAMKMISHDGNLLTIKYYGSGYTGGAHGYYYENYKTFDLQAKKVIALEEIVKDKNDKSWSGILMNNFTDADQKNMLLVQEIPLSDNFYFNENSITFVYNQYDIAAYAAGVVYIDVKWADIKDKLKPEFVQNYNIK